MYLLASIVKYLNFLKHFTSICKCTSFSIEIDFKCRPLFSTHRKHTCQARLTIQHAQNRICQVRLYASLALYSARTETHVQPRLPQVSHSIRQAQKTHMSREIDYRTRTIFGMYKTRMSSEIDYKSRAPFGKRTNAHVR